MMKSLLSLFTKPQMFDKRWFFRQICERLGSRLTHPSGCKLDKGSIERSRPAADTSAVLLLPAVLILCSVNMCATCCAAPRCRFASISPTVRPARRATRTETKLVLAATLYVALLLHISYRSPYFQVSSQFPPSNMTLSQWLDSCKSPLHPLIPDINTSPAG